MVKNLPTDLDILYQLSPLLSVHDF